MKPSRAVARARSLTACVTLAALLARCTTLKPEMGPYSDTLAGRTFPHAIVTRYDAEGHLRDVELHRVAVTSDSVIGFAKKTGEEDRIAIPLSEVNRIRTWHTNGVATGLAVAGVTAGLIAVIGVLACVASDCGMGAGWSWQ